MSEYPSRRSIRLKDYDYSQDGAYAITICTHERKLLFGKVLGEEMELNTLGCIVANEWRRTELLRDYVMIDHYMVMPNHFHGILVINHPTSAINKSFTQRKFGASIPRTIATIVNQFKGKTTKLIRKTMANPELLVWQGNYYEQIIRNEEHLNNTRLYIEQNPVKWAMDQENPERQ